MADETAPRDASDKTGNDAPPTVPSSPSADTHGATGTSTTEGPGSTPDGVHLPDDDGGKDHRPAKKGDAEIAAPGDRPDDEHDGSGNKTTTRQE